MNSKEAHSTGSVLTAVATDPFERDAYGKPIIHLNDPESIYLFGRIIRESEQTLLDLFTKGILSGTTHTCLGQELCQMSVVRGLTDPNDALVSNHRNHGHFLTYSGDAAGLLAEVMGRQSGVCGGVGGSQHLAYRNFHSNGVQGGMTANAVGQALSRRIRGESGVVAIFVGDGTMGEGLLYESLNMASIWKLAVLFVVENNRIAQTTPTATTVGGSIAARGQAFGLKTWRLDDSDPDFLDRADGVVSRIRRDSTPGLLVIDTMRLGPHSKGDDARPDEEMEEIRRRDPLTRLGERLLASRRMDLDAQARDYVQRARATALESPDSAGYLPGRSLFIEPAVPISRAPYFTGGVRASLNNALGDMLRCDPDVILLGEDMHDPYGGAFKVTAGLSSLYPDRVISTPISEAGITGAAIGLALSGWKPVMEIMFADFITLAMDQIYNHAVKFPGMFPHCRVPLVLRTPSGGRRGYGPTHSQCPESLACAVPGLTVVFPSHRHPSGGLLRRAALDWPYPVAFFEHKLLYGLNEDRGGYEEAAPDPADPAAALFPLLRGGGPDPDLTIVAYGYSVHIAEQAAAQLAKEEELSVEILVPSLLSPLPANTFLKALENRERVIVFEEGPGPHGFGAELLAVLAERGFTGRAIRVAAPPIPIPAARSLEQFVLPGVEDILNAAVRLLLS